MSKPVPIFRAYKADFDSELKIYNEVGYKMHLRSLKGELEITIKKRAKKTTDPQYGYLFGVVFPIITIALWEEEGPHANAQITKLMKQKFFMESVEIKKPDETIEYESIPRSLSRSKCSREDMAKFIDDVIHWATTEMRIIIPEPNQVVIPEYYNVCD